LFFIFIFFIFITGFVNYNFRTVTFTWFHAAEYINRLCYHFDKSWLSFYLKYTFHPLTWVSWFPVMQRFIHMWPCNHIYIYKSAKWINQPDNSWHELSFNAYRFSRLIGDWSAENMNPNVTPCKMLLDVRILPKKIKEKKIQ
jgi:hypothetical protein